MIKDYTTKRREFVDTIIKNGIISVNEIHKEMIKNDFSNGYSTDKNYIYSRLKTLGVDLIKIKILEVGTIFGDLTVLEHIGSDKRGQIYRFKCTCGNVIERNSNKIPKSCGCKKQYYHHLSRRGIKTITPKVTTYSEESTALSKQYKSECKIYGAMKQRCYNPKNNRYYLYGERGIKVCDRWLENFKNFFDDMGPRPSDRHSIDRIDSNGMYEPTNCRWATYSEQNANKSWGHYECPYCKELIGQKSNFNKHLLIHEKEEEIMKFHSEGKTQKWIADELSIPPNRVFLLLKTKK